MQERINSLTDYYQTIKAKGKLLTNEQAHRWSTGVLNTLGDNMEGSTKKELAQALPDELAHDLKRVFRIIRFVPKHLSRREFQSQVARRSGNTDPKFAEFPILAVFHGVKQYITPSLDQKVAQTLPIEVSELWQQA